MFRFTLITVVVLIAAVLILAATQPDTFRVQRSAVIKAPPERIYALVDDFHRWGAWSPREKMDPAMQRTFSGAGSGTGAVYAWEGNSKVGKGRMEIAQAAPPSKITIKLDFIKPLEGHNIAEFGFVPQGDNTQVTWVMDGPRPYIAKLMSVLFNMDRMIGKDFEVGLANLKAAAEQAE